MDGWLSDPQQFWSVRFHRDPGSWVRDIQVIVDHGREMPDGQLPLLKTRRMMRYDDAVALWKELTRLGWSVTDPVW